jgi:hypothetical protein
MLWQVVLGGILCGCATSPPLTPVPRGEALSIVVVRSPQADAGIRNQALGDNASTGAGAGILVGALSGLSCGPFAILCVPAGAIVGGVTGTVTGAAVGLTAALSPDQAKRVLARLDRVQQSHNLVDELARDVTERARLQWSLSSDAPTHLATIELQDIRLTSTRDERIGFVVGALVRVRPAVTDSKVVTKERSFEYLGPFISLADWLDDNSDVLDNNLSIASRQLALQIVAEFTPH